MNQKLKHIFDKIVKIFQQDDTIKAASRFEQVSYLLFMKIIDEHENYLETYGEGIFYNKTLFQSQAKRFLWSNWHELPGQELHKFLNSEVNYYLASLVSETPKFANFFRFYEFTLPNAKTLEKLVKTIDNIEFFELEITTRSQILEYLYNQLNDENSMQLNSVYKLLRTLMIIMVEPKLDESVFDPFCHYGWFLADTLDFKSSKLTSKLNGNSNLLEQWYKSRVQFIDSKEVRTESELMTCKITKENQIDKLEKIKNNLYGYDDRNFEFFVSNLNCLIGGINPTNLRSENIMSKSATQYSRIEDRKFDIILSNLLHTPRIKYSEIRKDMPFMTSTFELVSLYITMSSLAHGGRCAVIVPQEILDDSREYFTTVRKELIKNYSLLSVIFLPPEDLGTDLLKDSAVLIFRKPANKSKKFTNKTWFYDLKTLDISESNFNGFENLLKHWLNFRESNFEKAPGCVANSILESTKDLPNNWWVTQEQIAFNNYVLSKERYKPTKTLLTNQNSTSEIVMKTLKTEEKIIQNLQSILQELT